MPRAFQLALAAVCALAPVSIVAGPTAQQAQTVRQELLHWAETTLGLPPALLDVFSLRVVPEADHYRISVHITALPAVSQEVSVAAEPLPAGRWLLYDYRIAVPLRLHAGPPGAPGPLDMGFGFTGLRWDALVDPTLASPSVMSTALSGYRLEAAMNGTRQSWRSDALTGQAEVIPTHDGRVDIHDDAAADEFSIAVQAPNPGQSVSALFGRIESMSKIAGLAPDRLGALVQSLPVLLAEAQLAKRGGQMPNAAIRRFYTAARGIVAGGEFRETLDDVRGEMGGHLLGLAHLSLAAGVESPNGVLGAHVSFGLDGLSAPDIPPALRDFVPTHVLFRQSISGIDLGDVDGLIMAATAPGVTPNPAQPEIARRLAAIAARGITANLETLEVDLGATHIGATGQLVAFSPRQFTGHATISATGFDRLVAQMRRSREWGKFAPLLQIVALLGRPEGRRIVWVIRAKNADVLVNGLDIPALLAAAKELNSH